MADFNTLLGQVMADPNMMTQLASMAQSLGSQTDEQIECASSGSSGKSELMSLLLQAHRNMGGNEKQMALIQALKPFLNFQKAAKLDRAIEIAQMSSLAEQALRTLSASGNQAGDVHV